MSISNVELECYQALKPKLLEQLRQGKINKLGERGLVGLVNQGATCYLNALLKILFNITAFQRAVFQSQSESQIVTSLQRLFGMLSLSNRYAVGTKELTNAFGWSNAEVFDQHDAMELFSVLLDVVEKECIADGEVFSKLFRGSQTDSLTCPSCSFVSKTEAGFMDIPLHLPEDGSNFHALHDLIRVYLADERLSAENAYSCSKCSEKVQATKSVQLQTLPQVLILNLKRITFDASTGRRKKISDPVLFPQSIQSTELCGSDADAKYILTSVLLHNGSATGGHYRAIIREDNSSPWFEHNDADVRKLQEADQAKLFWYHSKGQEPSPTSTALSSPAEDGKGSDNTNNTLYEAAYVLVYQREDLLAEKNDSKSPIPDSVVAHVQSDNEELEKLQVAYGVYNKMTNFHTSVIGADVELSAITTVELPIDLSLSEATDRIYDQVSAAKASSGAAPLPDRSLCRLRRYERSCHHLGETFGGRDAESISALGLGVDHLPSGDVMRVPEGCSVALEFRKSEDSFVEFSGKEMQLRIARWALDTDGNLVEAEANIVVVPGEDASTVEGLRAVAATTLTFGGDGGGDILDRIVLMRDTDRGPVLLDDDTKTLKKDCRIYSGGEVLLELLPSGQRRTQPLTSGAVAAEPSPVFAALINRKQMIEVLYNIPTAAGDVPEYNLKMSISSSCTLKEFKEKALKSLGTSAEFHVRRSATGVQIKSEGKTLDELGIVNQSIIHLQTGPGCAPGEHMLRFEVEVASSDTSNGDAPTFVYLGDFPVKQSISVLQLKERLVASWAEIQGSNGSIPTPASAQHLRLRDGKVGAQSGPLRDERAVGKCLLGMSDGRKVVVQILQNAEVIGPEDILLLVRFANFESKALSTPVDMFIPRKLTVKQLCEKILESNPAFVSEGSLTTDGSFPIGIAKAFSTGPPITLKGSLKLKWTDDMDSKPVDITTVTIDQPPLSIRDGATLVVRETASFQRARESAKLRKAESGEGLDANESPMRGSLRPGTRGSRLRPSTNSRKMREKGVSINGSASQPMLPPSTKLAYDEEAPTIPPASPTKPDDGVVMPNAPVRVVKALRGDSVDA